MENIATKKFSYDHASAYKARGKMGTSNRNVRAQRASENRHLNRMDEVSKRRRMPLSPLVDENVDDKAVTADEKQNAKAANSELTRRDKLLKWREERKQKKGTEPQKKSFVVRHVKHDNEALLFANAMKKATKGAVPLIKPSQYAANKPEKRVTRASARIAKQNSNVVADSKTSAVKKVDPKSKAASSDKLKEKTEVNQEKTGRVTRQSLKTKASSSAKGVTTTQSSKKVAPPAEPKTQVKTRSQGKKSKDLKAPSEAQAPSKLDTPSDQTSTAEEKTPTFEKLNFPALDNIKGTVSVGRGSTEGMERGQPSTGSGAEAPSFAPADFQFTAPSGINTFSYYSKTFKFQPLSPKSAAEFLFPTSAVSFFNSPKKDKASDQEQIKNAILEDPIAACHLNNELREQESNQEQGEQVMKNVAAEACIVAMETGDESEKQDVVTIESASAACEIDTEIPNTQQQPEANDEVVTKMDIDDVLETQDANEEEHDAAYFRNLVQKETDRLNEICARWEKINAEEKNLSEEVTGQIRTTIGQAQLLIDQRFRQFSGLIDLSEDKHAEKQATASDLQGFWEMIYFQVEDVNTKFDALEKLKEKNWQVEEKKAKKMTKRPKAKKPTAGDSAKPSTKQAAARNRIQEMRMAMKAKMAAEKEKMRAEKRHQEEEAFVTILTPVKKSKKNDDSDEVVLTPVRRSIRKTPQIRSMINTTTTPVVVSTPKIISDNSPGLRLTPDTSNQPNELAITGTSVEIHSDTRECNTRESDTRVEDVQPEEAEMQCDLEQEEPGVLKSACKSTENKPRKSSGKVCFKSPEEQRTPECAVFEAVDSPMVTADLESEGSAAKKPTPRRFSARKCRGRMGTPFYQDGPRRRVSTVDEDEARKTESEGQSSSDSDSTDAKAAERCPISGLRRSARKTPSKYRDSTPMDITSDRAGKTPAEVSVKLFHSTEESTTQETPKNGGEQDVFSKYLCPSSSDEECEKEPMASDNTTENVFEEKPENLAHTDVKQSVNLTPPEEPHTFVKPSVTNSSDPKTGRTPIHLLKYLSDIDTPSPNSRQITPMPKTTIFVSPSGASKTPALVDNFGMMSPENVVRRFPAKNEGSPLLQLAPGAGKEVQAPLPPCSQLAAFSLDDSPANEKRRDSVFFAPVSTSVVRAQDNLMSFSPIVERQEPEQE